LTDSDGWIRRVAAAESSTGSYVVIGESEEPQREFLISSFGDRTERVLIPFWSWRIESSFLGPAGGFSDRGERLW